MPEATYRGFTIWRDGLSKWWIGSRPPSGTEPHGPRRRGLTITAPSYQNLRDKIDATFVGERGIF